MALHYCSAFSQTEGPAVHDYFNNFEDSTLNREWMNMNTISADDTLGNLPAQKNHFSRTDEIHRYSSGIEMGIPEDLVNKNFRISVRGLIRVSVAGTDDQVVIAVSMGDSSVYWKGEHISMSSGKTNTWNGFEVSTLIPRNIHGSSRIKIFLWNADGKSLTDVDNLNINFTEIKLPSFLPK